MTNYTALGNILFAKLEYQGFEWSTSVCLLKRYPERNEKTVFLGKKVTVKSFVINRHVTVPTLKNRKDNKIASVWSRYSTICPKIFQLWGI